MHIRSHPVGLDVWFPVWPFVYFHTLWVRTAKALARLCGCAGSPEPSLVAYMINTIISWACSIFRFELRVRIGREKGVSDFLNVGQIGPNMARTIPGLLRIFCFILHDICVHLKNGYFFLRAPCLENYVKHDYFYVNEICSLRMVWPIPIPGTCLIAKMHVSSRNLA